jgi:hypothetical protein
MITLGNRDFMTGRHHQGFGILFAKILELTEIGEIQTSSHLKFE